MPRDASSAEGSYQLTIELSEAQEAILAEAEERLDLDRHYVARQAVSGGIKRVAQELQEEKQDAN